MPTAEVNGVQVDSTTGTLEELTAQLTPAPESTSGTTPKEQAVETGSPAQEPTHEPDPASEAGKQLAGKRKSMQDRIDQITWEKHEAVRRAEKAEAEAAAGKTPSAKADDGRPKLKDFVARIGADFDDLESAYEAHADALTDFKLASRDSASAAASAQQARQSSLNAVAAKGREAHADFDAVIGEFVAQGGRFAPATAAEAQGPLGDLESVILQHPLGQTVAYEVAKDPELRARLLGASSRALFMDEMGTLLTRLKGAPTGSPVKPAPVSKAKPPVQPAKGQPHATDGPPGDDATDDEYRVWANAQDLARRRR